MELVDHALEAVEPAAVVAELLGGQEVCAEHGEEDPSDATGHEVRDLLGGDRLARHPEVAEQHEQRPEPDEDPAEVGAHGCPDPLP